MNNYFSSRHPLWGQAFRPMFLLGTAFSAFAVLLWGLTLQGIILLPASRSTFWHSHEMLFGFSLAIVVGFLLTAVQNWTGQRATHGRPLVFLTLLWLAGRLCMLAGDLLPWWLTAIVDLALLPVAAWFFWRLVHSARQKRNYFFVPVLLIMLVCNVLMHWGNASDNPALVQWGSHAVSWILILLIGIVGGRVMPMFTANGTMTPKAETVAWLEKLVLGSTWLLVITYILHLDQILSPVLLAVLLLISAAAHALRCARLRIWLTWKVPLLWSLHLSYWFIPLGLLLLALHYLGLPITFSTALHALTVGAVGGMIMAMIARISLGHSGRPLQPHPLMSAAFIMVLLSALIRSLAVAIQPQAAAVFYALAAVLWILAIIVFVLLYFNILTTPRPDGRPG